MAISSSSHPTVSARRTSTSSALLLAIFASLLIFRQEPAYAWGAKGHQIVAIIAAGHLTSEASTNIATILGEDVEGQMARASTWADTIRRYQRNTAPWHYVDIELSSKGYVAGRDCPTSDCVVAQIENNRKIVADSSRSKGERVEALMFVIHFVGDIHQPLHAADNHDKGGNGVYVIVNGRRKNIHAVWDNDVVNAMGRSAPTIAAQLDAEISSADKRQWESNGPVTWANESFDVARTKIYSQALRNERPGESVDLPADYADLQETIARRQLEAAGVRLAHLLNDTFRKAR